MKKTLIAGLVSILLASSLLAQSVGDKVDVILKNGGELHAKVKGMDENMVYLDLSIEYKSSTGGSVGIPKSLIDKMVGVKEFAEEKDKTSISEIRARLEKENQDIAKRKEDVAVADMARVEDANKKTEADKKKAQDDDVSKKVDDLTKELQLLKDFPTGTNKDTYPPTNQNDLMNYPSSNIWDANVYKNLSNQFTTIKIPLTVKQQNFVDNYDLWKKAITDSDKLKSQLQKSASGGGDNTTAPQNPPPQQNTPQH